MAITRTYTTKRDCVQLYFREGFSTFPSWVVTETDLWEKFDFQACYEEDGEEYEDAYGYMGIPMWGTWFIPVDSCIRRFIEENPTKVMDCGFTIIYDEDGELFALGIDGAGYSFIDNEFTRLYDAEGLKWHE